MPISAGPTSAAPTPHSSAAVSAEQRPFCFTVPHAQDAAVPPVGDREPPAGWQGITAGWLAAADSGA